MNNIEQLIRKVSHYVSFGQPVASGSVLSQRLSDPRIPIQAYYLGIKPVNESEEHYLEVWLQKNGLFAITEARYRQSQVNRSLYMENLSYDQLKPHYGEEETAHIAVRLAEIVRQSEKDDWKRTSRRFH